MKDDTRAARAADQADPERNHNFSRPWLAAPPIPRPEIVTGPDEPGRPAHPLAWHPKPKAVRMLEQAERQSRASWWTR